MFNINYINCITEKQNITFVAHSFMHLPDNLNKYDLKQGEDILLQKLNILYNLKWKNNNCNFTESIYKYERLPKETKSKLIRKATQDKTIGIIICKKDNKYIIEYYSDKRIIVKEYELL